MGRLTHAEAATALLAMSPGDQGAVLQIQQAPHHAARGIVHARLSFEHGWTSQWAAHVWDVATPVEAGTAHPDDDDIPF